MLFSTPIFKSAAFLPAEEPAPTVQPHEVSKKLLEIKSFKAHGPDNVPCRILKEFAYELAEPVATIFNTSLSSGIVPAIWKDSDIIPVPKSQPPTCEGDTRPISLTPCLAKVPEDFVVGWMITDIKDNIDPKQFGCLKGTSTTYCLLDMIHTWLCNLECPEKHLRLCFLDFEKAFDRIGHNLLILKLLNLGVRSSLLPWIINFLTNRRHRVKLGGKTSDWLPMNASVPQGTKLGPILFLAMINDLDVKTHATDIWKFVDDISTSENITKGSNSKFQFCIDTINSWASCNLMKLNTKKCKELRVCFLRESPDLSPLLIDGHALEVVRSHKVLGLVIQNDLKWNAHIESVVSKASKRLYIIRILRRGGVPVEDLLSIYFALIRSVMEYCCVVWHHALPLYLADELEPVQKRALRIILPGYSYREALAQLGCSRLDERREQHCLNTMKPCNHSKLQPAVDHISNWSKENFLQINPSKCKEIYFTFKRIPVNHVPIEINGIQFDKVPSVKLLGLTIQNNFKWNAHVDAITSKAAKRLYLLRQLKRAGINTHDLVQFYCAVIRSVLEYACQVFHRSLPDYLSTQIEAIQRRAMRTIYPDLNYAEALEAADLVTLFARRDKLSKDLFEMIASDTDHKLASLLPLKASDTINLRRMRDYQIPKFRTNRFKNSFIISHAIERYRS